MNTLKQVLPKHLFGRALLILIIPTILVIGTSTYVFYERHWDNIHKHRVIALAGEITFLTQEIERRGYTKRHIIVRNASDNLDMDITFHPLKELQRQSRMSPLIKPLDTELRKKLSVPLEVRELDKNRRIQVRIQIPNETIQFSVSTKRLASATTYIFIMWMVGAAVVFMIIATLFLHNQIRPITQLAEAAEAFGRGQDLPGFKPRGAKEVRQAGLAFIGMKDRITRQITKRTEMLAAISHDLRTPLTRMRLQLALIKDKAARKELESDVEEMQNMITEYLDFVREPVEKKPNQQTYVTSWKTYEKTTNAKATTSPSPQKQKMV